MSNADDTAQPEESEQEKRRAGFLSTLVSLLVAAIAILTLLAYVPALPSAARSVTHFSKIGDSGADHSGYLKVASCVRARLVLNWSCQGRWNPNGQTAQPVGRMTLMNDPRHLAVGSSVEVTHIPGTTQGYLWGRTEQARVVLLWVGVLLGIVALVLALAASRRRWGPASLLPLVISVVLLVGLKPYW